MEVTLPARGKPRERWLTRNEAARLIRAAWRYREVQKGHLTGRRSRQHVARFVLVALYTRAGAVCAAAFDSFAEGAGYIDLERGVFRRRPKGEAETKKRKPVVKLPDRLRGHLRRWHRNGQRYAVEWYGNAASPERRVLPRMHDKSLVFCRGVMDAESVRAAPEWHPYAVWTGSFNLTFNAADSLENAVVVRDEEIARAYASEFGVIFGLSEPLDWTSDRIAPQYRIGT